MCLFHPRTLVHHGFKLAKSYVVVENITVLRLFCLHGGGKTDFQNTFYVSLYTSTKAELAKANKTDALTV